MSHKQSVQVSKNDTPNGYSPAVQSNPEVVPKAKRCTFSAGFAQDQFLQGIMAPLVRAICKALLTGASGERPCGPGYQPLGGLHFVAG
jgi:hypothetical protein